MRIDKKFLKKILEAFEEHPSSSMTIKDLSQVGLAYSDEKFVVHLEHLNQLGYIQQTNGRSGIGLKRDLSGDYHWSVCELQMSAEGHYYLEQLIQQELSEFNSENYSEVIEDLAHYTNILLTTSDGGFQPALLNWVEFINNNPVTSDILRRLMNENPVDFKEEIQKSLLEGYLPVGNKRKEKFVFAYLMSKYLLSNQDKTVGYSGTMLFDYKLSFRRINEYTDNIGKLISDFKGLYINSLSQYLMNELNALTNKFQKNILAERDRHSIMTLTQLSRPRSEAHQLIQERIDIGSELYNRVIKSESEFDNAEADFKIWDDYNGQLLISLFTSDQIFKESYKEYASATLVGGRFVLAEEVSTFRKEVNRVITKLRSIQSRLPLHSESTSQAAKPAESEVSKMNNYGDKVFIVHGRNHGVRDNIERYLMKKLNIKTVIMEEEVNQGKTLPEKFESLAKDCGYAIFVATMDDHLVYANELSEIKTIDEINSVKSFHRARQNVILEIGFFWGMLGRQRLAVLVEEQNSIDWPSDLQGIVRIPSTTDLEGTKARLRDELEAVGLC